MKALIIAIWVYLLIGAAVMGWYVAGVGIVAEEQRTIAIVQRYCPQH